MAKIYRTRFENEDYNPRVVNTTGHTVVALFIVLLFIYTFACAMMFTIDSLNMCLLYLVIPVTIIIGGLIALCATSILYVNPTEKKYQDKALFRSMLKYDLLFDYDNMISDTKGHGIIELLQDEVNFSFEHNESFVNENIGVTKYYIRGVLYDSLIYTPLIIPTDKIDRIAFRINPDHTYYDYYENEIMVVYLKRGDSVAFLVASEKKGERNAYKAIKEILGDMIIGKYE